jgi:thiol-disulfide isomerase/thioredoxin
MRAPAVATATVTTIITATASVTTVTATASATATTASASAIALRILALALALPLALPLAACGGGAPHRTLTPTPAASATPLPPIELHLRDGASWTARAAEGRVLVIDVWATYCVPCRKAFPKLGQLAAAYPDAVVVGISVDENDADVESFLREVPAAFLIARDPKQSVQSGPLQLSKLPTLLVVDRAGRLRLRREGVAESDYDLLPELVSTLLAEPATPAAPAAPATPAAPAAPTAPSS